MRDEMMKVLKTTKSKVKDHIKHARKLRPTKSTEHTKYWAVSTNDTPSLKKIDDDVWSVEWGGMTVEFSINLLKQPFVSVYPDAQGCRVTTDVLMTYGTSVVNFNGEDFKEEEVKPMVMMAKKKSKKEGKGEKKKDYYYKGKEVKAQ